MNPDDDNGEELAKAADKLANLMTIEGISIEVLLLAVTGMYVGEYFTNKYPTLTPDQLGTMSTREFSPYIGPILMQYMPMMGVDPKSDKALALFSCVVSSLLHDRILGPIIKKAPGSFDPRLDRADPKITLDDILKNRGGNNDAGPK